MHAWNKIALKFVLRLCWMVAFNMQLSIGCTQESGAKMQCFWIYNYATTVVSNTNSNSSSML